MIAYAPAAMTPTLAPASALNVPAWVRLIELVPNVLAIVLLLLFLLGQIRCERFVYAVLLANLFACAATLVWYSTEINANRYR